MTTLKLYQKVTFVGTITNIASEDTFDMSGDIELSNQAEKYTAMFAYLTDEEAMQSGAELPFDPALLDDWYLEDEHGIKTEIPCPGIYLEDKEIHWRV